MVDSIVAIVCAEWRACVVLHICSRPLRVELSCVLYVLRDGGAIHVFQCVFQSQKGQLDVRFAVRNEGK